MVLYIVLKCRCFVIFFFHVVAISPFRTIAILIYKNIVIITIIELSVDHVMLTVNKHNSRMIKCILFRHQTERKVK